MGIRFAFDLGTNSIGFAVWQTGPDAAGIFGERAPLDLLHSGVRLFKDGRNPKDGQSLAAMRRIPKQARVRRDRFVLRRSDLIEALVASGLMPFDPEERRSLEALDPYRLRTRALDERLEPFEIGRAIFHLHQRRGFKSNRKTDRTDEDKGKINEAAKRLEEALKAQNCRTLGEFLWLRHRGSGHDPARPRDPGRLPTRIRLEGAGAKALYEFYPTRALVRREFELIWQAQAQHHPDLLTDDLGGRIAAILFRQRDLKPPKIGRCTVEPGESRLPKALPSVQARELYERLAHLRLSTGPVTDRALAPEERDVLAGFLLTEEKLTFAKLRKVLKLGSDVRINMEEAGEAHVVGCRTNKLLAKTDHFGPGWLALPFDQQDRFVQVLIDETDEEVLVRRLVDAHCLAEDAARKCATVPLPDGYARLGPTANAAILQALQADETGKRVVIPYAEAVRRAGEAVGRPWHHSDERDGEIFATLPYYGQVLQRHVLPGSMDPLDLKERDEAAYWGRIMNPTVHIGLNQLRRVVNALIEAFGSPDEIVVELARELKQSAEKKRREQEVNRRNRDANARRSKLLSDLGVASDGESRARLKLFEEQQAAGGGVAFCPFSGRPISVEKLFSDEVEIEHILPRSRTLDDSAANKVLCYRDMNRLKRGRTPFEAFGASPGWEAIAAHAEKLPANKRWRFRPDSMDHFNANGDFLQRQLNETKYLSRIAKAYLGKVCNPDRVYVVPGTLTGLLRGKWGLNSLLSDDNQKNRTDHRHHAIDAIVLGAMTRGLVQHLAREAGRAEQTAYETVVGKVPWPFESFRDAVRGQLEAIIVSNKPEHGKSGALHEDTAYGLVRDPAEAEAIGNLVRRKPVLDLTPAEVNTIRDSAIRRELQEETAPFRDAKGKVKDLKAFQAALAAFAARPRPDGRLMRRVRLGKADASAIAIADRRTGVPYKALAPGENHHIDIVQMWDGSWQGFAASVFEVNRKGWRPEWEREKLGGKLVMRLHKGDAVEVLDEDGVRRVKSVVRIHAKSGTLRLVRHHDGGEYQKRHDDPDDPFRWEFAAISKLKERGCIAVRVDPIGRVVPKRSNVRPSGSKLNTSG